MLRYLFLLHRYLGMGIAFVLVLWSLSGIVMMYKPFPELTETDSLSLLSKLNLENCCNVDSLALLSRKYTSAQLEMSAGQPILRLGTDNGEWLNYNLKLGMFVNAITSERATFITQHLLENNFYKQKTNGVINKPNIQAEAYQVNHQGAGFQGAGFQGAVYLGTVQQDQWTMESTYSKHRPLHKFNVNDKANTEIYVSSLSGEIVQLTTSEQRFWAYLGPIVHWIYPTILRQNVATWSTLVIWLTISAIVLTCIGLIIGFRQFGKRGNGRLSPYRSVAFIHHYAGLVFGILALLWLVSGLLSMNPWGLLESDGHQLESQRLQQRELSISTVQQVLQSIASHQSLSKFVRLDFTQLQGQPSLTAFEQNGTQQRLNIKSLQAEKLTTKQLSSLVKQLQPDQTIISEQWVERGDKYYYQHHQLLEFPVYRVILDDTEQLRYYLSPISGKILMKISDTDRWYRWLVYGIHRADFTALLRSRPLWDFIMLISLSGAILLFLTGSIIAVKRAKNILLKQKRKFNN